MYKVSNMSPKILNYIFPSSATPYNLRNPVSVKMRKVHLVYIGSETLSHIGPEIWNLVLYEIRPFASLGEFKSKIKKWIPSNCPCRLSKISLSSKIYLKRLALTSFETVSTINKYVFNI